MANFENEPFTNKEYATTTIVKVSIFAILKELPPSFESELSDFTYHIDEGIPSKSLSNVN